MGKELELVKAEDYALMRQTDGVAGLPEILKENVGDAGLGVFDLDRIKIPSGGGQAWEIPTLDGVEVSKSVEGIIIAHRDPRSYWEQSLDESGGGSPPDCSSLDGRTGVGNPGGDCGSCQFAQWGSKEGGGQACKQMKMLFILRADDLLPLAVFLPPTSITPMRKYLLRLAGKGIPFYTAVTKLELEPAQSKSGIAYSKVSPTFAGRLAPDVIERVREYKAAIEGSMSTVAFEQSDVERSDDDSGE